MQYSSEDYIDHRINKAWLTYNDAKALAALQSWNSSINRLYYACFYIVLALFARYDIESHTHSGVKTQLTLRFIKTGRLDRPLGLLYTDLFDFRHKGDYGDFFDFNEQQVMLLIPQVEHFIREVENLISKDAPSPI